MKMKMKRVHYGVFAMLGAAAVVAVVLNFGGWLAGCGGDDSGSPADAHTAGDASHGGACANNFDCPSGYTCQGGTCAQSPSPDGGGGDVAQGDTGGGGDESRADTGGGDAGTADGGTGDGGAAVVTIYQIQNTAAAGHPAVGSVVTIQNVVATTPVAVISSKSSLNGFFVQEKAGGEFSGIIVTGKATALPATVTPGDVFTVTGSYAEYKGATDTRTNSEIDVTAIEKTGTDAVPAPVAIANPGDIATAGSLSENYQGVLVKVSNVAVTAAPDAHGQWKVTGDLMVDKLFYAFPATVGMTVLDLTGVLYTSFDDFKIEPRSAADITYESIDGGGPDAAETDTGNPDAGETDAGGPDAGETDAGTGDAGTADAGEADAGAPDAGEADAGASDSGASDGGTGPDCTGVANHVVISQVQVQGAAAADEFVELYNPTGGDVAINGWRLRYKTDSGGSFSTLTGTTLPAGAVIKAHGFFLFTATGYDGAVSGDKAGYTAGLANAAGHVQLYTGSAVVDTVGYGATADAAEGGHPASAPPANQSITRKSYSTGYVAGKGDGYDTDDNANDFTAPAASAPRSSASPIEDNGCP